MSTLEVLGLRKHQPVRSNTGSLQSKTMMRHHGYLKDMLVNKFLNKHKLEVFGPVTNESRELEIRIQALVIKEFEKFIKNRQFNQRNLQEFELELRKKIKETIGTNPQIKLKDAPPRTQNTQRVKEIQVAPEYIDKSYGRAVRNSTTVGTVAYGGLGGNQLSLPNINSRVGQRNALEQYTKSKRSLRSHNRKSYGADNKFNEIKRIKSNMNIVSPKDQLKYQSNDQKRNDINKSIANIAHNQTNFDSNQRNSKTIDAGSPKLRKKDSTEIIMRAKLGPSSYDLN